MRPRTGRQALDQFLAPVQQALAEGVVAARLRAVKAAQALRVAAAVRRAAQQSPQDTRVGN